MDFSALREGRVYLQIDILFFVFPSCIKAVTLLLVLIEYLISALLAYYVLIASFLQNSMMMAKPQCTNKLIISFASHWTLSPSCSSQTAAQHGAWVSLHAEELPEILQKTFFLQ